MSKKSGKEKQQLRREVETAIQEEQDIQAAIKDPGFFYDESRGTDEEYLAQHEEERMQMMRSEAEMYDDFFWGDYDDYDREDDDSDWDGE